MENILVLTEHLRALVHHFLWPSLFPWDCSSSSIIECKPLLSSCTLKIQNQTKFSKLIPSFSVLSSQQGQAGKRRENLFQEGTFREHSNRLSTCACGWTLWRDLKPPWGDMHAKNHWIGKSIFHYSKLNSVSLPSESLHSALCVLPITASQQSALLCTFFFHTGMVTKAK